MGAVQVIRLLAQAARTAGFRWVAVALLLGAAAVGAFAASAALPPSVSVSPTGFTVGYGTNGVVIANASRTFAAGSTSGEALVRDMFSQVAPSGGSGSYTAARTIGAAALRATAIGAAAAGGYAVGSAIYDWMQGAGVRPTSNGGWEINTGGLVYGNEAWLGTSGGGGGNAKYSSAFANCQSAAANHTAAFPPNSYRCGDLVQVNANSWTWKIINNADNSIAVNASSARITEAWCFNFFGQAFVQPTGGVCPSGSWSPGTAGGVEPRLQGFPPPNPGGVAQQGTDLGFAPDAGPLSVTGPSTVPGPGTTTTTQNPDGSSTTRTTTPTTTNTYPGGGVVNQNTTTITTTNTCTGPGSCSAGPTTTETGPEVEDPCKANPNRAGCANLGDPPADSPQWQNKQVDWTAEALGLPSGCPGAQNWTVGGMSLAWSYAPACDIAPMISVALQACVALGCALLIAKAVQT